MGKNQHVVPHGKEWAVRGEGNKRVTSIHDKQQDAIDAAREAARKQESELLVHGRKGIRSRNSYGNDPTRSKG